MHLRFRAPRFAFALTSLFMGTCPGVIGQIKAAQVPPRVVSRVDENVRRTLHGNTHALARPEFDHGLAAPDLPMSRMLLVLTRSSQQEAALQDLLQKQHEEGSPEYHQWLTPDEFGLRFGPADSDLQAVTTWLESNGMRVARVYRGRNIIEFSGTVAQVQHAFHTEIHRYVVGGEEHLANASDPEIPAALTPVVAGIASLHSFKSRPQSILSQADFKREAKSGSTTPQFTAPDGSNALSPADYAVIYNINPVYQSGITGKGTTIGVVARTNIKVQDVVDFRQSFGLSNNAPQIVVNGPDPGDLGTGEEAEAVLDASWSGATAPGATVKLVVSASTNSTDGIFLSEAYIIDNNLADIMTESFGSCEANFTQAQAAMIAALAEQAAAQGITYAVAAGDSGSAGCDDPNTETFATGPLSVNILASTPYTVAVGGTEFVEGWTATTSYWNPQNGANGASVISYIPEQTWNETCTSYQCPTLWAGGGGVSRIFSKPSWQTGVLGIPNDGARDVPDIALTSAGHDPYLICLAGSCQPTSSGQIHFAGIAGTSAATPAFGGIMSLVDQKTGSRQGQANYVLYRLAASESFPPCNATGFPSPPAINCLFNDITSGSNSEQGTFTNLYFQATPGYDMTTGLGSLNVANVVNQWTDAGSSGSKIHISIDQPEAKKSVFNGTVQFGGWAVSDTDLITTVTYAIDGIPYGAAIYGSSRADVCAAYSNRPGCPNVGWNFLFDTNLLPDGIHTVDITAVTNNGQTFTSSSNFKVDNGAPPMRICIDSPGAQSGTMSGPVTFAGWAIDDFAAIGSVAISIDGVPDGTAAYGGNRPDVCAVYPGRNGCPNVGWAFPFDTSLLSDGSHTLEVRGVSVGGRQATATATFNTSNASGSPIKISVDRPNSQSAALSGIANLGGWAIDANASIETVAILVDGVAYGNAEYGGNRADVCSLLSGAGCPNVGWNGSIDTTLLSDGSHTLQIAATSSDGQHATISTPFKVANLTGNSIRISIDNPASNSMAVAGTMAGGWAIDDQGAIAQITVSIDGVAFGNASYGSSRPDVCALLPGRAGCPNVGWSYQLDTTLLSNGTHTFEVTALSSTGKHATASTSFQVTNWTANPTKISIDVPNSASTPLTGVTGFAGWAVDDYSAITNVAISIDGIPYGNALYGANRPDVCNSYPGRFGCPNVGWSFLIDTSLLADGVHLLEVTAHSSEGWQSTATSVFTLGNLQHAGMQFAIDYPNQSTGPVSGVMGMAGWAFSYDDLIQNVLISIDGVPYGNAVYGLSRPDVSAAYPGTNSFVGWSFTLDTTSLANGPHKLTLTFELYYFGKGTVATWFTVANPPAN